jgi:hypothetical protein
MAPSLAPGRLLSFPANMPNQKACAAQSQRKISDGWLDIGQLVCCVN